MLKTMSLASLGETVLAGQFAEAMAEIQHSLEADKDVSGERKITVTLAFRPGDRGIIEADMACMVSTPRRKVKTIAILEAGTLKIDTVSSDARQPDLYDNDKPGA